MSGLVRKTWNRDMSRHGAAPARTAARQTVARRGATARGATVARPSGERRLIASRDVAIPDAARDVAASRA